MKRNATGRCVTRKQSTDVTSIPSVQASLASHQSNHPIVTSHHPSASILQTNFTNKQIQLMAKRTTRDTKARHATPRHATPRTRGQSDRQPPSLASNIVSQTHTASPRLACPHARTHAREKKYDFLAELTIPTTDISQCKDVYVCKYIYT